jgi:hypothetical protein
MSLFSTYSILRDVLFKAGEPTDGTSEYHAKVLDFLNQAQYSVCEGGGEIVPDLDVIWNWLRKDPPGTLVLRPASTRAATFTEGSTAGTFAIAPTGSFGDGWVLKTPTGRSYRIASHTTADTAFTLDTEFIEGSGSYTVTMMKFDYELATDLLRIIAPLRMTAVDASPEAGRIEGSSIDQMVRQFGNYPMGTPVNFALVDHTRIRLSHCLPVDTDSVRVEYDYTYLPDDLTDSVDSSPVLPKLHRKVIGQIALMWLYEVKNDVRAADAKAIAQSTLMAMAQAEKKGRSHLSPKFGQLQYKRRNRLGGPKRTESGLIIG